MKTNKHIIMKTKHALCGLLSGLLLLAAGTAQTHAGLILFNGSRDTIRVNGNTTLGTAATYEARVWFPATFAAGAIFNEYAGTTEDKIFYVSPTLLYGGAAGTGTFINLGVTLTLNQWHHIAYVYDGSQKRMYLDGSLVGSLAGSGDISDNAALPFIGANAQGHTSFQGYMDTLRISDVARYSGASFTAPTGDLTTDANTQLLFNFNEAPGSLTAADSSASAFTGTLGIGIAGATSPEFVSSVPEPGTALVGLALLGLGAIRRRRRA